MRKLFAAVVIPTLTLPILAGGIYLKERSKSWTLEQQTQFILYAGPAVAVFSAVVWLVLKRLPCPGQRAVLKTGARVADPVRSIPEDARDIVSHCLENRLAWTLDPVATWADIEAFLEQNRDPQVWYSATFMMNWDLPQSWSLARFMLGHPACPDTVAVKLLKVFGVADYFAGDAPHMDGSNSDADALVAAICIRDHAKGFVQTPFGDPDDLDRAGMERAVRAGMAAAEPGFPPPLRLLSHRPRGPRMVLPFFGDETGLYRVTIEP